MNDPTGESELLEASLHGSREAYGAIVDRYQSLVCAITYCATGDVGRSEELAQETFIRAWRNLRQLRDLRKFRAWLCTIARNLAGRSARNRAREVTGSATSLERAEVLPARTPGPPQVALDRERQEMVWAAVGRVPLKYREPLVLFYRRGQSVSEVAADLELSGDTVRQRLHRGRQLIKAEVSSLVEDTLVRSGPGKAFAIAVVAALPALIAPPASAAVAGVVAKGTPAAKTLVGSGLAGGSLAPVVAWVGALLGPILGLLGGVFGAWCSIKNTRSPRERRFMIRMTVLVSLLLIALIGVPLVLMLTGAIHRGVYRVCLGAFFVVLVPLIFWGNARQRRIQIADGTCQPREDTPRRITRAGVYGTFSGSIFGPSAWLLILAGLAGDWTSFLAILGCDALIFWAATAISLRRPDRFWSAAFVAYSALAVMTLVFVNLRWNAWMVGYRQSSEYSPVNDVSLRTIDLIIVGAYLAFALPMAWWHVLKKRKGLAAGQGEAD